MVNQSVRGVFARELLIPMGTEKAQRLASLRTRLLAFDYGEPVGPESVELVERLLGDLVSTTDVSQLN